MSVRNRVLTFRLLERLQNAPQLGRSLALEPEVRRQAANAPSPSGISPKK